MQKIKVLPYSRAQLDGTALFTNERSRAAVSHLQPVIDYLLSIGNKLEYPFAAEESPSAPGNTIGGGWQQYPSGDFVCSMKSSMNLISLNEALDLPATVTLYEDLEEQSITCQDVRAAIVYYKK